MKSIVCTLLASGLLLTAVATLSAATPELPDRAGVAYFEQHVRPLLVKHCYECHSGEAKVVQGGLRLDSKPAWEKGGDSGPVIVPGQPEKSLLVRALEYDDEDVQMPPKGKLPPNEIAMLRDWVVRGAPDPRLEEIAQPPRAKIDLAEGRKHWAFQPLAKAEPPAVKDSGWCRTPLDRFIAATLEAKGVRPNPIADRRTLIRRAYLDLIGLPPTPEAVEEFIADSSPKAYDKLIAKLLDDPHFGERWARHWLDLARYGESHGFEQDYDRPHAYTYRDFVVRAFNQDLPYDTFVRWQIAGDEIAPDNPQALFATGFLSAGVHATQITANQAEKERYDELDDMSRTIGTSMLGLTVGCARCHDHKYDPIPNVDYYRLLSTFTKTVRSDQIVNVDPAGFEQAIAQFEKQRQPLVDARSNYEKSTLASKFDAWLSDQHRDHPPARWLVLDGLTITAASEAKFQRRDDGSYLATNAAIRLKEAFTIKSRLGGGKLHALRLEALPDDSLPAGGPGLANDGAFDLKGIKLTVSGKGVRKQVMEPTASWLTTSQSDGRIVGRQRKTTDSSWAMSQPLGQRQTLVLEFEHPAELTADAELEMSLDFGSWQEGIGRLRLSIAKEAGPLDASGREIEQSTLTLLDRWRDKQAKPTAAERQQVFAWYCTLDPKWRSLTTPIELADHRRPRPHSIWAEISSENVPAVRLHTQGPDFYEKTYIVKRGDPNQKLEEATPGFLQVLLRPGDDERRWQSPPSAGSRTSNNRRALADWLTDDERGAGQLLARVIVNRLWYYHLGRGIVATPSDFGTAGVRPSHPELLDYLANELIRNGWRLKPIHQAIMTSAVYMQTSDTDAARKKVDVHNRLFWHRPVRRLEAETIRDAMLAVGGLLDASMYGPGMLEEHHRRSLYFFVKRSQLVPMMMLFDGPDTLQDLAVRSQTTVAPQALLMLNGKLVRECAEGLANRASKSTTNPEQRVARAYALALSRSPTDAEQRAAASFLKAQTAAYESEKQPNAADLAWADFCQVLLGLNEFLYLR